jgi:hypothetical protein
MGQNRNLIAVPAMFYDDHAQRGLPTPAEVDRKGRQVLILAEDPAVAELRDDAAYYADPFGPDMLPPGLRASAKRTVAALAA